MTARRALPLIAALLGGSSLAVAISPVPAPVAVEGVLSLSATAQIDVPRDWIRVTLSTSREGADPAVVQRQLRQALDSALLVARRDARQGQLEVQTGAFAVHPRHAPKGGIATWQGRAELIVQGRDFAAIAQLAGAITTLSVADVAYLLSREARQRAEAEAAAQAIASYRAQAADYARQFGHGGYTVREVHVGSSELPPVRPVPMQLRSAPAAAEEALPIEAGQGTVSVTVSGTIQMK